MDENQNSGGGSNPTPSDQGGQTPPAADQPASQPAQPSAAPAEKCVTCGNSSSGGTCVACGQGEVSCSCTPAQGGGTPPMGGEQPQGAPAV